MSKGLFGRVKDELTARAKHPGLNMTDMFDMPEGAQRRLLIFLIREKEVTLAQIITHLRKDESEVRLLLTALIEQGLVREIDIEDKVSYRPRLAYTRKHEGVGNMWATVGKKLHKADDEQ